MSCSFISLLESMKFCFRITRKKKRDTEREKANPSFFPSCSMVDRISSLPDELLCHILTFLPIKLVFTTTVLSKRWASLCYSLPVINCDDETTRKRSGIHVKLSPPYSTNQPLKMFRLNCFVKECEQNSCIFNAWLEAAKQRRVEQIHLLLNHHTLKPNIFISRTLVVLKLHCLNFASDTSCADLPSLKTLHLTFVEFKNRNDYIKFLSACPILEDFHAKFIFICSEMKRSEMNLHENNAPEEEFKSLTLFNLVRASIDSMDALFNGIDNVKFLHITSGYGYQEASVKAIPLFRNLIHIQLIFYNLSFGCWDGVVDLLRLSPKLQILYIKKWLSGRPSKEWKCPISIIECVSSHLRSYTILNFQGSANDLRFTKYILKNASLLQDMKIGITTFRMLLDKSQIQKELSLCPRISQGCKLTFDEY